MDDLQFQVAIIETDKNQLIGTLDEGVHSEVELEEQIGDISLILVRKAIC